MAKRTSRKPKRASRKRTSRRNTGRRTSRRNRRHSWAPSMMRRNSRLSKKRRSKLPASKFVFPKDRAWPIESAKAARDAIKYIKMGRVRSASDYMAIRNFIMKHYPAVWREYGLGASWPKSHRAHLKGMAHRRATVRAAHRMAANSRRRRR